MTSTARDKRYTIPAPLKIDEELRSSIDEYIEARARDVGVVLSRAGAMRELLEISLRGDDRERVLALARARVAE